MIDDSDRLNIRQPDDWHVHLRDGDILSDVVPATARQFARAVVMPNLRPPITTHEAAIAYRTRVLSAVPAGVHFEPLMVLYLTDNTTVEDVVRVAKSPYVHAFKLYPSGVTTNSDLGVSDVRHCFAALQAMQRLGVPLLIHGEVPDQSVDVFDREAVFIDQVLQPLRRDFPELRIVLEHITTRQAVHYVRDTSAYNSAGLLNLAATITPQHLLFNRNAIFKGGLQPHWYCLPVLKREEHRLSLLEAATGGLPQFFLGTDSAPHAKHLKEAACGCAGCYSAPIAIELYAQAFDSVGKLHALEAFSSEWGAQFYGFPLNTGRLLLERCSQTVPNQLSLGEHVVVPLCAGESLVWSARLLP